MEGQARIQVARFAKMESDVVFLTRMLHFHVNIYARPPGLSVETTCELRGMRWTELRWHHDHPQVFARFLPISFEEADAALRQVPQLDAEPDGFFVLAGDCDGNRWQVSGHLFDLHDRLHRVELHGACPEREFDALLACIGGASVDLAFELPEQGIFLNDVEFRRWASVAE